jgi:Fe-S-cluster containining protein
LNFHAQYRCRHTGACCRAGWTIPFDPPEAQRVHTLALRVGRFATKEDGTMIAARQDDETCTFFETGSHLCAIHAAGGQAALPLTCRMFPRVVLHDARGTFLSLSHFCPTAASLLFEAAEAGTPVSIADAPSSLTDVGPLDGLDARDAWPPLLRPGVLMDLESFGAWERLGVELLTREGIAPRASVEALSTVTARITEWTPGPHPLLHAVRDAFGTMAPPTAVLDVWEPAVKRWLAARLFGTWIAYQGTGLQTIVRYLGACLDVFTIELARDGNPLEAIRRSDLLIVHEADSQQLATLLD